jgi:TCP-1/cpn60 chaperonin family
VELVRKALRIPCFTIASNAGVDAQEVVQRVISEKFNIGYDAMNGVYVDMMKSGIIDPTKVSSKLLLQFILFLAIHFFCWNIFAIRFVWLGNLFYVSHKCMA